MMASKFTHNPTDTAMRRRVLELGCALTLAASLAVFAYAAPATGSAKPLAGSGVKVIVDGAAHGSGTYIGRGDIITAAHVAKMAKDGKVTIKTDDQITRAGFVQWINTDYDVALIHIVVNQDIQVSDIDCNGAPTGAEVYADGNPSNAEFLRAFGHIAGSMRQVGPWKEVVPTDMTTIPGMSGGGVFDYRAKLVGVNVGVMLLPITETSVSVTNFGYIVPSSTVCKLLSRA